MQAVILAGGRGTRLKDVTGDLPKPLVDFDGKPLLAWQLELLARAGATEVLLLTGYRAEIIRDVIGDGSRFGLTVRYVEEDENNPLGTAGALLEALDMLQERFVVLYGDTMVNVDIPRFIAWHHVHGADASLLVHPNDHPEDSDLVEASKDGKVRGFHPYPHPPGAFLPNLVNAALYVMERSALAPWRERWKSGALRDRPDIAKHLFPAMLAEGAKLFAYRSPEYIKDAGTPKRHAKILGDILSGRIARSSLSVPQKAIFLDRDGTLNVEANRVTRPEDFRLIDGVAAAVRRINETEFRAVVITNQPVLARGDCDEATLDLIHAKMDTLLGQESAYLDAIYYCPHHPHGGYPGEVPALKIDCTCRKPKAGMLLDAQRDLNIDFGHSWMIGDSTVDIKAAHAVGVRAILIRTGKAGQDGSPLEVPDFTFDTLSEAVDFVLKDAGQPSC